MLSHPPRACPPALAGRPRSAGGDVDAMNWTEEEGGGLALSRIQLEPRIDSSGGVGDACDVGFVCLKPNRRQNGGNDGCYLISRVTDV